MTYLYQYKIFTDLYKKSQTFLLYSLFQNILNSTYLFKFIYKQFVLVNHTANSSQDATLSAV